MLLKNACKLLRSLCDYVSPAKLYCCKTKRFHFLDAVRIFTVHSTIFWTRNVSFLVTIKVQNVHRPANNESF